MFENQTLGKSSFMMAMEIGNTSEYRLFDSHDMNENALVGKLGAMTKLTFGFFYGYLPTSDISYVNWNNMFGITVNSTTFAVPGDCSGMVFDVSCKYVLGFFLGAEYGENFLYGLPLHSIAYYTSFVDYFSYFDEIEEPWERASAYCSSAPTDVPTSVPTSTPSVSPTRVPTVQDDGIEKISSFVFILFLFCFVFCGTNK